MRFRKPTLIPAPRTTGAGIGRSRGTPDWLKEWLANRGQYVKLSCGCYEDLTYGALLIIAKFGLQREKTVYCERCNIFAAVRAKATSHEFFGLPRNHPPEEPLF